MRLPSRVLVVLVVCLIAMALPALSAQAAVCVPYGIELSPKYGLPGTEVIVSGHDFSDNTLVDIYYDRTIITTGRTDSSGDFTFLFTVPEDSRGPYEVEADVGYTRVYTYFTVMPGLTVSPETGPVGTNVTVKGQGFDKNETGITLMYYYLSGGYYTAERNIEANAKGSWEVSFPIPSSAKGEHKIDAEGDVSRPYEVIDAIFRLTGETSIDKSSGLVGDSITMTGSKFAANEKGIRILFDGEAVVTDIKADVQGDWEASFPVPEMPTGEYSITADGEQTKKEDLIALSFEIKPDIVLSAYEGHVGMDLTVTGHGFAANQDVAITYDGSQVVTAETDDQGSFEVSFLVPESQYGERLIAAADAVGNNTTAIFTMESTPPPMPTLISPSNRSRVGIINKVRPTFEWSAVSDDSGVHYSLQIATSDNFTTTGEFVDPMVSITGLVQTSYTLNETEALPCGTYYWIVQAVDGAENESGWTATRSFRAGLLPLWAFILIIVAIVVLFVALIRALLRRRIYYY